MIALDAADRLALDWAAEHPWSGVVIWGEDVRSLAEVVRDDWPDAVVAMWNDFVGPDVPGVQSIEDAGAVDLVLLRLPKSLAALGDWTEAIRARFPDATLVAFGRLKHMTLSQNEVLRHHYADLTVSHARQKSRLLIASGPREVVPREPAVPLECDASAGAAEGLRVIALGGVFAGAALDIGTRVLLETLDARLPEDAAGSDAIDLGCGSGIIAAWLARRGYRVRASDRSLAAVYSTRATAEASAVADRVDVHWEDALAGVAPGTAELIVLNPPFHDQTRVTVDPAHRLFAAAARTLAPGGRLITVWNSHLRYREHLERVVGPTEQWTRTPKFTVTVSTRVERNTSRQRTA
ncbi:MAG: class I SAM-dependent methyltransferase [Agromyces sp.]